MRDFALEVYFSRWEFTARYNLGGSDAETMSQKALLELASAEDRTVLCFAGAEEAIYTAMKVLLSPADHVRTCGTAHWLVGLQGS